MYRVVIPARFASTRLPGKALLPLAGKPMIQWVYERAQRSHAQQVLVATDDERIASAARGFGAEVRMTAARHGSGTDRIAEVAFGERWSEADVIVNLQGDEPLMPAALIDQVAALMEQFPRADIGTLAVPLTSVVELMDPNVVKVVTDRSQRALYFSRAPIPWSRDSASGALSTQSSCALARRHVGIYAYRVSALKRMAALPASELEQLERLEQLRALENGMDVRVTDARVLPGADVNTAADLAAVEARLRAEP